MKKLVFCSQKHNTLRYSRWAALVFLLLFTGCFDSESGKKGPAQKGGIASISRFFASHQEAPPEKVSEAAASAESIAAPNGLPDPADLAEKEAELGIAVPSFVESDRAHSTSKYKVGNNPFAAPGSSGRRRNSSSESAAAMLLNSSFDQLFASVFGPFKKDESASFAKDEPPNPFTEARQKQEAAANSSSSDSKTDVATNKSQPKKQAAAVDNSKSDPSGSVGAGAGVPPSSRLLVVGDFDGSGILSAIYAEQSSATRFVFDDGERDFDLYINPAAVEQQRAFSVDDINGDGYPDLLVTNRASLFGGVLLGDGDGAFRLVDKFLTGYEPIVPAAGPFQGNMRDVLAVNMRSGALKTFRWSDRYRPFQKEILSFVPSYLLHLFARDTSSEYLMAAQTGGLEQIFGWNNDGLLAPIPDGLGADPTVLSVGYGSYSLRAYQVGSYASIVLTSDGASFNVANMRVNQRIFLIIGDLLQQGSRDVAVAHLTLFTPKSNH